MVAIPEKTPNRCVNRTSNQGYSWTFSHLAYPFKTNCVPPTLKMYTAYSK